MRYPKRRGSAIGTAVTVAGMTAATAFAFASPAAASHEGVEYAYGISASGLVKIDRTPYVESTGAPKHDTLVEVSLPPDTPVASAHLLNVHAKGRQDKAQAQVTKLGIFPAGGQLQLPKQLRKQFPDQVRELREQLMDQLPEQLHGGGKQDHLIEADLIRARCHKGDGSIKILELKVAGKKIQVPPGHGKIPANTTIALPPNGNVQLAEITLNKQVQHKDGSLTVTALRIELFGGTELETVINVSQAHCGDGKDDKKTPGPGESTTPDESQTPDVPESPAPDESQTSAPDDSGVKAAPAPEPVSGNFPVTG